MKIFTLAAGVAVGYVLGSRAGHEKYEQILATARRVTSQAGSDAPPADGTSDEGPATRSGVAASAPGTPGARAARRKPVVPAPAVDTAPLM